MGTRSFHSCSRCLVLPFLIRRLDPSPLVSRRQSLGRRSWVGAPLLVRVGCLLLSLLLFLFLSLLSHFWVDHLSPQVSLLLSLLDPRGVFSVAGLSSPATSFAPSVSAPAVACSVSSGSEGCVPRLPAYQAPRLHSLLRFPLLSLSFFKAYLLVPPSSVLPSAPLASSQPVGTSVSVSLGSGCAMGWRGGGGGSGSDGGSGCQCEAGVSFA